MVWTDELKKTWGGTGFTDVGGVEHADLDGLDCRGYQRILEVGHGRLEQREASPTVHLSIALF